MRRIAAGVLMATVLVASACSSDAGDGAAPIATRAPSTTTTAAPERPEAFAVGTRSIELVDAGRPTAADPARGLLEQPNRTLPVLLLYPADGPVTDPTAPVPGAAVADDVFPLVVFSHGVTSSGPVYQGRIQEWARAGYVVAAPTYPLSSGPGGLIGDYVNQPADVSFVIDELLDLPADDPLRGHIDPGAVAAAGHSLGAITTLGVSLNSCCADDRLTAAVELSGIRLPFPDGDFDDLGRVPILAVHGGKDGTVPVAGSDSLFDESPGPIAYLRLADAGHSDYLISNGPLVDQVVIAFLDAYLRDDPSGLREVTDLVDTLPNATFEQKLTPAR